MYKKGDIVEIEGVSFGAKLYLSATGKWFTIKDILNREQPYSEQIWLESVSTYLWDEEDGLREHYGFSIPVDHQEFKVTPCPFTLEQIKESSDFGHYFAA